MVRIISHGCSGTVIYTEEGRSFILSCGHAFRGSDRNRPVVLDVPAARPGPPQNPGIQVLETDHDKDLSLLILRAGPLEHIAPVAPVDHRPGHALLSVGYDNMQLPAVHLPSTLLQDTGRLAGFIQKPYQFSELLKMLEDTLSR